jgi:hypothetical protein
LNVRLSEGALRCRITRAELEQLLSGRAISLAVVLPRDHVFRVSVRAAAVGGWQLDSDPTGVWLTIPRAELESLTQNLPSRDGLEHSFDTSAGGAVQVSFEVDVRERGASRVQ